MTFADPGSYQVSLNVSNASGSSTRTRPEYFWVGSGTSDFLGLSLYGYEDSVDFYSKFPIYNTEENNSRWQHCAFTSYSGTSCAMLNTFGTCGADKDEMVTGSYDLTGMSALFFSFWYSGAITDTTLSNGTLKVYASKDCGSTWTMIGSMFGAAMAPAGLQPTSFVPSSASHWTQQSFPISASYMTSDVRFKLSYTNGPGANNIFVDDLETMHMVGINEYVKDKEGKLFPNPAELECYYELALNNSERGYLILTEPSGKLVRKYELDKNQTRISTSNLAKGVYFCTVFINGREVDHQKLVVR
jgi:PKD repeat protein